MRTFVEYLAVIYFTFNRLLGFPLLKVIKSTYLLDAATSSGILKAKQKLGRTFNSDKLGDIAFTKISKLTMCSA